MRCEDVDEAADGVPEAVDGALGGLAQHRLQLREGHLDWIEVWTVGRKEGQPCALGLDHRPHRGPLVTGEVVHDHDVAGAKGRRQ